MKKIFTLLFLFSYSLVISQNFIELGTEHFFYTNDSYIKRPFKLNNYCNDTIILVIDCSANNIPDNFQILDYYTDSVLYESGWLPFNPSYPNSQDGTLLITNDSVYQLGDTILPNFNLTNMDFIESHVRFEIITTSNYFKFNVIRPTPPSSSGAFYIHNPQLNPPVDTIISLYENYVCDSFYLNFNDTIHYSYNCLDSIVIFNNVIIEIDTTPIYITTCVGDSLFLFNENIGYDYLWSDGYDTNHWIIVTNSSTLYIDYILLDCIYRKYYYINAINLDYDSFFLDEYKILEGEFVKIDLLSLQDDIEAIFINGEEAGPFTILNQSGLYHVEIINENGCYYEKELSISVVSSNVQIPNAFTPDNDGINDVFKPLADVGYISVVNSFVIYNRWGELVYKEYNNIWQDFYGWDGRKNNIDCHSDVYIYNMILTDCNNVTHNFKGEITLIK